MKALLVDYGGKSGAKDAALCVCRAYGRILRLADVKVSIVQLPRISDGADLVIIVPRQQTGVSVPPECREALWRYLIRHSSTPYCVALPTTTSGRIALAVREASLLAMLDVTPPTNPPPVVHPRILTSQEIVEQALIHRLDGVKQRGCLNQWVKEVSESADKPEDRVAFLSGLTEVAAACEGGRWLSDHGVKGSRIFQRSGIATFRSWCDSLKAMKADRANTPLSVAVLDDQPDVLESFLLPTWLWKHSGVKFIFTPVSALQTTIDSCTTITGRLDAMADVFLLDMDWRHAGQGDNDRFFKTDGDRAPKESLTLDSLSNLGKYLLDLIVRYNEQYRNAAFHEVAAV
ncbi:MAG: hypothetical protein WCL44_13325, partial [bacterium]